LAHIPGLVLGPRSGPQNRSRSGRPFRDYLADRGLLLAAFVTTPGIAVVVADSDTTRGMKVNLGGGMAQVMERAMATAEPMRLGSS